jgi:hypothetical protein
MYRSLAKQGGALVFVLALSGNAVLAQGTSAQQDACRPDVFRLCGSFIPDVGEIVACLRGNESRLSAPCRQVMFADHAAERYATSPRARSDWHQ